MDLAPRTGKPPPPTLRRDALALSVITVLALAYFYPLFLGRTNSILAPWGSYVYPWASVPSDYSLTQPQTDYAELSYPWLVVTDDALSDGTIPFWAADAYGGGYELYANGSSAVLYPPRLAALAVTSPVRSHDLFLLFHLWASGVAMYVLARELSLRRAAATFGAVVWMFAAWNTAWMQLEVVTPLALFLPASFAAVHFALSRQSWRAVTAAAVVCGLALMAGHVLFMGVVVGAAALYGGALTVTGIARQRRSRDGPAPILRHLARPAVLFGGAGLFAAVTLLPTALALLSGQREPFTYAELQQSFLATPGMFRRLWARPPLPLTADAMQTMAFVGSAGAVLAFIGAFSRGRPGAWLGRILVAVTFLVTVGTPLTWIVYRFVPAMNVFRPWTRLMVLAAFGMAILAMVGIQMVLDLTARAGPRFLGPRSLATVRLALVGVLTIGSAAQMMRLGREMNPPFVPHEARYALPDTPLVDRLQATDSRGWPERSLPLLLRRSDSGQPDRLTFYGASPLAVGVDTTSGYDSSVDRRTTTLLRVLQGVDTARAYTERLPAAFEPVFDSATVRFDLAARLGVTTVATAPPPAGTEPLWSPSWTQLGAARTYSGADGDLWSVPDALPGPRLVTTTEVVATEEAALNRFADPTFPAPTTVVVEQAELARTGLAPIGGTGAPVPTGEVSSARRGVNTIDVAAQSPAASWLVLPDAWAQGWTATVNGVDVPVARVNFAQRAVQIPAGASAIHMRYRSAGFDAGLVISAVAWATALATLGVSVQARARRRAGSQTSRDKGTPRPDRLGAPVT